MSISIFEIPIYRLTNGSHQTADFILYLYKEFIEFQAKNTVAVVEHSDHYLAILRTVFSIAFLVFVPMLLSNMVIMKKISNAEL